MRQPIHLAAALEDAVIMAEEILEREDMDVDQCNALEGFILCGSSWCEACGCIVDKLHRAEKALTKARASIESQTHSQPRDGEFANNDSSVNQ